MNFKIKVFLTVAVFYGGAACHKAQANAPLSFESELENLLSGDLQAQTAAIGALKQKDPQLENPAIREEIVARLLDPSDKIQQQAIWALRDIKEPEIQEKLLELLSDSSSPFTKKMAIFALANNVRQELYIEGFALSDLSLPLQTRILELLSNPIPTVRQAAALAFSGARDFKIQEQIARLLSDRHAEVRRAAVLALREASEPSIQQKMAELLSSHESPEVREAALLSLRGSSDPNIQERILALLSDPSPRIRARAIFALRGGWNFSSKVFLESGASVAVQEKIVESLSDPDNRVRREALQALNSLEDHPLLLDQLAPKLLDVLPNMGPEGKISIMNKLARQTQNEQSGIEYFVFISDPARLAVTRQVSDPDFKVKQEALRLLFLVAFTQLNFYKMTNMNLLAEPHGAYDDSTINQFLRDYFLNTDFDIKLAAIQAFSLVRFHFDSLLYHHDLFIDVRNSIVYPLLSDPRDEVRRAALQALKFDLPENLIPPDLVEFVRRAQVEIAKRLLDKNEEVRLSAVQALNPLILSLEILSEIKKLLLDTDERVRLASVRLATKAILFPPKATPIIHARKDLGLIKGITQTEAPIAVKRDDFKKTLMYLLSSDPSAEVRLAVAQALSSFSLPEIEAEIAGKLLDKNEEVRLSAVQALRNTKDSAIRAQLEQVFLHDPSLKVKRAILSVFGPLLIHWDHLKDIDPDVRSLFIQKTVEIAEDRKFYDQYPFSAPAGQYSSARAEAIQNLLSLLSDPIPEIRKEALRALQSSQNPEFQERLADLSVADPDSSVRALATDCLRAIQKRQEGGIK